MTIIMKINRLRNKAVSFGFIYKLNLKDLMSGGINLIIFSILIIMGANISNNVKQLFISICMSSSLRMKGQGIVIPLID